MLRARRKRRLLLMAVDSPTQRSRSSSRSIGPRPSYESDDVGIW
jgi:hypothetical protein